MLAAGVPETMRVPESIAMRLSRLVARWQGFDLRRIDRELVEAGEKSRDAIVARTQAERMLAEKWSQDGFRRIGRLHW